MIELVYTLFLLSGLVKSFLLFYAARFMVIDFTLLCAIVLVGAYIIHAGRDFFFKNSLYILKEARTILFALGGFYIWMIFSLLYTPSPHYAFTKTALFITDIIAFAFPFLYSSFDPRRFVRWFVYTGTGLVLIYSVLLPGVYASYLRNLDNKDFVERYLEIGYLAGIVFLLILFACPHMRKSFRLILAGINAYALFISSARGPLIFLGFVLFIKSIPLLFTFFKKARKPNFKTVVYITVAAAILFAGAYFTWDQYSPLIDRTIMRLERLFTPETTAGIAERVARISFSIDSIFQNANNFLFGSGIGSFGILYENQDIRSYPHNIFLEIGFEMGIIGVLLFLFLLIVYLFKIRRRFDFLLIVLYLILNSLKSYSLVESRVMFGIFAVLLLYASRWPLNSLKLIPGENK